MENKITINNNALTIKEYNGQRVVTLKDIDMVHGRVDGTARKRFNDNKRRFIEGEDFYKISPSVFRTAIGEMDVRQSNDVILITESGYLMLVKSFTDDLAWTVQRQLVKSYFRAKQLDSYLIDDPIKRAERWIEEQKERLALQTAVNEQQQQIEELTPKATYCDTILNCAEIVPISTIAKDYGKSAKWMNKWLHEHKVQYPQGKVWLLYQKYAGKGYTQSKTYAIPDDKGESLARPLTCWTQKGRMFLYGFLKEHGILPLIEQETAD